MSCELTQIEKICRSFGGINLVQIILPEGLLNPISASCDILISDTLEFVSDKYEPINVAIARDSGQFSERHVENNRNGDYFEQSLSFEVPKSRREVGLNIHFLKNRRVHILFRDRNGMVRIMLNAKLAADTATRQKRAERNGYSFRAGAESIYKAPYYTGELLNLPQSGSTAQRVMGDPSAGEAWGDPSAGEVWKF